MCSAPSRIYTSRRVVVVCSQSDVSWTIEHALAGTGTAIEFFQSAEAAWVPVRWQSEPMAHQVWIVEARQVGHVLALLMMLDEATRQAIRGLIFFSAHSDGRAVALQSGFSIRTLGLPFSAAELRKAVADHFPAHIIEPPIGNGRTVVELQAWIPSRIVTQARTTLGISEHDLSKALQNLGRMVSPEQIVQFEGSGRASRGVELSLWEALSQVLALPPETLIVGYDSQNHLSQIRAHIAAGRFDLPVYPDLRRLIATQAESVSSTKPCSGKILRMDVR